MPSGWLERLAPDQAGALWIGILAAFLVFGDARKLLSSANLALVGFLAAAPLFVNLLVAEGRRLEWTFNAIFAVTAFTTVWAFLLGTGRARPRLVTGLTTPVLTIALAAAVAIDGAAVFGRSADDAGIYTNLGAQRWTETGRLPYADPLLKGENSPAHGAAATYGPLLYVAHLPFQTVLGRPGNPPDALPQSPQYVLPPMLATQLTCFAFHLLGLFALYRVVARSAGREAGLGAAVLYAACPYVIGLGGDGAFVGGLAYISHIAPSAVVLLALVCVDRHFLCGALLAAAAGLLYYPAFFFPLWFAWRLPDRRAAASFAGGFAAAGVVLATLVIAFTPASGDRGSIGLFLESTIEHQEGATGGGYGVSPFSFWGQNPGLAGFWQHPLIGAGSLFKPTFLCFAALCIAAPFFLRGRSVARLAALSAMLAAGVQLWKTHGGGTYVEWFVPLLIVALVRGGAEDADPAAASGDALAAA